MEKRWEGDWIGHYDHPKAVHENGGHRFGVEASLLQWGGGITGTMVDLEPSHTVSYRALVQSPHAESWSPRERYVAESLLRRYPEIVLKTSLPVESELVGKVSGTEIDLEKKYLGPQLTVWLDGDRELGRSAVDNHVVRYRGTLSEDGLQIVGSWTIRAPGLKGLLGKDLERGDFRLVRQTSLG